MKLKGITFAALLMSISLLFTGCAPLVSDIPQTKTIYATFYPIYALTDLLCSGVENVELQCLVQPQDGCLRSYELSDWDLYMLAYSADAIISAGNDLESFSAQLQAIGESMLPTAEVMYGLELYEMTASGEDESHFAGTNPHLYMSIDGAGALLENIAGALMVFDENNAELYEANLASALDKLYDLRQQAQIETEVCENIPAAVLTEAAFYAATDCSLKIVGHYPRENSEMLYGDNLQQCLDALEEMGAKVVLLEKQAPAALVKALEDAGFAVASLNIMSELSEQDGALRYLDALQDNVLAVAAACGRIQG